jgi:hypothetical protein
MRAVFTIDLPRLEPDNSKTAPDIDAAPYPERKELIRVFRSLGWEPSDIAIIRDAEERHSRYASLAEALFEKMPEIAAEEKSQAIFYGLFAGDHTKFVITRPVAGQLTFRLLNPVLPRLQSSTIRMVRQLINAHDPAIRFSDSGLRVVNGRIDVYEVGDEHIIIGGRVITRPGREAERLNRKDSILTAASTFASVLLLLYLYTTHDPKSTGGITWGTVERLSTAMITTMIVSGLGLLHTYWDIRKNRLIAWGVHQAADDNEPLAGVAKDRG